ncbi:hypothetical protein ASZ90_014501 [hydrocarbon metagenome]|uniref:Calpain catalytic domain-containing protein n=1 Tax=hydrocarbon metagenome TaxID=938273 RepID=A0A0W8F4P9_9ZZZZ
MVICGVIIMAVKTIPNFRKAASENSDTCGANLCDQSPKATEWKDLGKDPVIVSMIYNEAIQGCCNDCYFIAALSSVAWAAPQELDLYNAYYFNGVKVELDSKKLPVANNTVVYADIPTSGEIWAPLYEKAYAKWRSGNTSNEPDIPSSIGGGGSGFQALKEITGYTNPANAFDTTNESIDTIWQNIQTGAKQMRGIYETYKTTYPSFAETRSTDIQKAGIYKSHTYSLFGKVKDTSTGKRYLILRNPYANKKPEPVENVIKPAISFFGINLSAVADGVFALDIEKFKEYFLKYGSVKP